MKLTVIEARDLSEAWFLCVKKCYEEGYEYTIGEGSYAGQKRKEFDMVTIHVKHPDFRPLVPDTPPGIPPPTSIDYVEQDYLPYLMTSKKKVGELYTYGEDIEPQLHHVTIRRSPLHFR